MGSLRRLVPVVAVTALWLPLVAADAGEAGGRASGAILFTSDRDGRDAIYAVNTDGTGLRHLFAGTGARWTRDGRISYFSSDYERAVIVVDADGQRRRTLVRADVDEYDWSPAAASRGPTTTGCT